MTDLTSEELNSYAENHERLKAEYLELMHRYGALLAELKAEREQKLKFTGVK